MEWTKHVRLDERGEKWIMADLENSEDGIFTVDTDPPGMQVFIDGRAVGLSRVETMLHPGWHVCTVIPGPGLRPLLARFHLQPGEALTRRVRMSRPAVPATSNVQELDGGETRLAANQQGGPRE
jgi:hypothetical protein